MSHVLREPSGRRRCAVIGDPVAHSLSPVLHTAAYADLGLQGSWTYGHQHVTAEGLAAFVDALDQTWGGVSVTMPHKQAIIDHLDLLAPTARLTHAVNTVLIVPDTLGGTTDAGERPAGRPGLLVGANTDVYGIEQTLRERLERPITRAVIVGARATASSALVALHRLGAREVGVAARRLSGPGSVAQVAERLDLPLTHVTFDQVDEVREQLTSADVVVCTVPQGVADQLVPALDGADLAGRVLLDVVYDPWPTAVAGAWERAGGVIAPGWEMLLHQAWLQVRLMTGGREADVSAMRAALTDALAAR